MISFASARLPTLLGSTPQPAIEALEGSALSVSRAVRGRMDEWPAVAISHIRRGLCSSNRSRW
jgi:hypothetical protein